MCGIIGYCGPLDAQTVLLDGLTQLEYRGYDSAGIALFDENSKIHFIKKVGKVFDKSKNQSIILVKSNISNR